MKARIMKSLSTVLCIVMLIILAAPAYADAGDTFEQFPMPRWSYISTIAGGIEETSTAGRYFIGADAHLYNAHYTAKVKCTLQKYNSGWKNTSHSWSGSGLGVAEATGYLTLSTGNYRVRIDVTVYSTNGEELESITTYSSDKIIA